MKKIIIVCCITLLFSLKGFTDISPSISVDVGVKTNKIASISILIFYGDRLNGGIGACFEYTPINFLTFNFNVQYYDGFSYSYNGFRLKTGIKSYLFGKSFEGLYTGLNGGIIFSGISRIPVFDLEAGYSFTFGNFQDESIFTYIQRAVF